MSGSDLRRIAFWVVVVWVVAGVLVYVFVGFGHGHGSSGYGRLPHPHK